MYSQCDFQVGNITHFTDRETVKFGDVHDCMPKDISKSKVTLLRLRSGQSGSKVSLFPPLQPEIGVRYANEAPGLRDREAAIPSSSSLSPKAWSVP